MVSHTLRGIVNIKHEEIEKEVKSFRLIQDLLSNLLKTSDKEIHGYPKSFRVMKQNEQ